jgi:hypothetical protein
MAALAAEAERPPLELYEGAAGFLADVILILYVVQLVLRLIRSATVAM